MSLDLGELVGTLRMDLTPFDQALAKGDSSLVSFSAQAATRAKAAGTDIGAKLGGGVTDGMDLGEATTALDNLMKTLPATAKGAIDKTSAQFQALSPALKKAVTDAEMQANFDKLPDSAKQAMAAAEAHIKASGVDEAAGAEGKKAGSAFSEEFVDKAKETGKLAGAAVAGGLTVGVVDNMSLEQGRLKLAAQLGMSVEDSARLGKIAGEVYADNWGENRAEVDQALGAVMSSIRGMRKASDSELQAATETALAYASTFEIDLPKAVNTAGVLMKSGLAGSSSEAFDLLTKASSRVPAALREDILDATDEYGQFFNSLGYSGPQAFDLLVQGSAKGMYGIDKAGDAIKEFTIRSTDMSTSTKGAYKTIGLDAQTMANDILAGGDRAQRATQRIIDGLLSIKDPAAQGQAAIALFGTPLEDLNTGEIPQFLQSLKGSSDSMKGWRDSAQQMADTAGGGTANSIETTKRKIQEYARGVIEATGPTTAMAGAVLAVAPAVQAAIGPIGWLIARHGAQTAAAGTAAAAESAAATTTQTSWLRASAASVAGAARTAGAWLLAGGTAVATYVAGMAVAVASTVAGWVVMGAQAMLQAARMAAAWLIALGPIGLVIAGVAGVALLIYKYWDQIKAATSAAWGWVVDKVKAVPGLLIAYFMNFTLPGLIIKHWDSIKSGTQAAWNGITGFVKSIPGKLLGFFLQWNIVSVFIRHWDQMRAGAVSKGGAIVSWVAGLPGRLLGALGNLGALLLSKGQQMIAGLQQGASNRIGAVVNWVQGIPGKITGAIPNPLGMLSGIGGQIIDGLKAGISAGADRVMSAVNAIIDKIPMFIRKKLGIASPSKVMKEIASWIPAGVAEGIRLGTSDVEAAMNTLSEKIAAQFEREGNDDEKRIKKKYARIAANIKKTMDGDKERKALKNNEDAEEKAIKKADKANREKNKAVLDLIKAQQPAINANAAAHDAVAKKLEEQSGILTTMRQQALDYATSVRDSFNSFGSITSLANNEESSSIDALLEKRRAAAQKADDFAAAINQLRGRLNENDLKDLVAKGPEALTVAQGIVAGGDGAITEMNNLQARMVSAGQSLGNNLSNTFYQAGIDAQQNLVNSLTGNLAGIEAAGATLAQALLAGITKAMEGIGDAADRGADKGTKGGKGGKGGKRVAANVEKGAKDHLKIKSPSQVFAAIGGNVVDGMILGLDRKAGDLEDQVGTMMGRVTGAAAGASLDVGLTASAASAGPAAVPQSAEVAAYAAQQAGVTNEWNIYETTDPRATAMEVSRRQSLAGAGA